MVFLSPTCSAAEREAATRRAIIGVAHDYYAWSAEDQERYRTTMPTEDRFRIRQSLLKTLFGIDAANSKELEAALSSFSEAQYLTLFDRTHDRKEPSPLAGTARLRALPTLSRSRLSTVNPAG